MQSLQFIASFTALHDKAKKGVLSPNERAQYASARDQFGRFMIIAQQNSGASQTLRSPLRMMKMLKVELRPDDGAPEKTSTLDISSSGFAVLSPAGMRTGQKAAFTLYLPAGGTGSSPVTGRCVVASSRPHTRAFKVSFKYDNLLPAAQEQIEFALIDAALERFNLPPIKGL